MSTRLSAVALWSLLLLPLALSPVLGLLTPYVALAVVIPLLLAVPFGGRAGAAYSSYEARVLLAVFGSLAIVFAVTADSPADALRAFNFTMLLAYGPIALLLARQRLPQPATMVSTLAAIGVLLGAIEVFASALLQHAGRPTAINVGPIVLSNALLALGFVALGGALLQRGVLSWLYLAAPLLAIAATVATGSRGPLLAVPFALVAAAMFFWRYRLAASPRAAAVGALGLLVVLGGGAFVLLRGRAGSLPAIVGALLNGTAVADENTRQRLVLYRAGWQSFLASPWIGHGWGNLMQSVQPFLPPADAGLTSWLPQLHNDVLNFAVAAGVVGVGCYAALVSAPVLGALLSPRDALRPYRLYGTTMLTIVYVGGGLTDLMFGFEFHTFLFVMLAALLLHFCRVPGAPA